MLLTSFDSFAKRALQYTLERSAFNLLLDGNVKSLAF